MAKSIARFDAGELTSAGAGSVSSFMTCSKCGSIVPADFKFCGVCGETVDSARVSRRPSTTPTPSPHGTIVRLLPDGTEDGVQNLRPGDNRLGRSHGQIFEEDGYLSPTHAVLILEADGATVRDLDSLNGVFIRIRGEEELQPGQFMRIGQELLRFDVFEEPRPRPDGTEVMGSPNPGYWGKLTVISGRDGDGPAYPLIRPTITLGRDRGDINFPDDGYVSGLHARVSLKNDGRIVLADLGSSNGTFIQILGERKLSADAILLMGQQLFRVQLP